MVIRCFSCRQEASNLITNGCGIHWWISSTPPQSWPESMQITSRSIGFTGSSQLRYTQPFISQDICLLQQIVFALHFNPHSMLMFTLPLFIVPFVYRLCLCLQCPRVVFQECVCVCTHVSSPYYFLKVRNLCCLECLGHPSQLKKYCCSIK